MSILSILNELKQESSTKGKEAILVRNSANDLLKRVMFLTYGNLQYYIKTIPELNGTGDDDITTALDVLEHRLATRSVTGHDAIDLLVSTMEQLNADDQEVVKRIIKRDLDVKVSGTTANKVWPKLIPQQPQMLASSYSEKSLSNIKYPAIAQLKADGARCFAEITGTSIVLKSRNGNEYTNLTDIENALRALYNQIQDEFPEGVCIDGELVYTSNESGLSFLQEDEPKVVLRSESNGIANKSLKGTISQAEQSKMMYQVWDLYSLDTAYNNARSAPYAKRFEKLKSLQFERNIAVIESTVVNNLNEARAVYKKYVDEGLEGIILKNMNSLWENKRSKNQVKFKEEITIDMKITGVYPHKKDDNKLGGFSIESACGTIKCNVGSGLTDTNSVKIDGKWVEIPLEKRDSLNREYLWSIKDDLIGSIIEIKCNGWVDSQDKVEKGLFLPIVMRLRHDKDTANTFDEVFN